MHLAKGNLYHIFNRGNNRQEIFLHEHNYHYFIQKLQQHLLPSCEILSWCLMPNHFHLLVYANSNSIKTVCDGRFPQQQFSRSMQTLLSHYTLAINKENNLTGSLFQQNTKAVFASSHAEAVFHYIHQNPLKAELVTKMEDWPYSSFRQYARIPTSYNFCNLLLANELLQVNFDVFYQESYSTIDNLTVPHQQAL